MPEGRGSASAHEPLVDRVMAAEVSRGLCSTPKCLSPRYLYDTLGSALFDAICLLPWYRVTRAERDLLLRHRAAIVDEAAHPSFVAELGPGNGQKLHLLLEAMGERRPRVYLVDVSADALARAAQTVAPVAAEVTLHQGTYEQGLRALDAGRGDEGPALVAFLGSNIGNFDPGGAARLLGDLRATLRPGDALLLGADLVKPEADLLRAYDDPLGVTAAFNKNLLVRLNTELCADFDVTAFDHQARWDAGASRVEMHLVSRRAQRVFLRATGTTVEFAAGESIWTESSYKFTAVGLERLGERAGFSSRQQWLHDEAGFAITLYGVPAAPASTPQA